MQNGLTRFNLSIRKEIFKLEGVAKKPPSSRSPGVNPTSSENNSTTFDTRNFIVKNDINIRPLLGKFSVLQAEQRIQT